MYEYTLIKLIYIMKKIILMGVAFLGMLAVMGSCSKSNEAKDTQVVGEVVGEEVVMPESDSDTAVIAEGEAVEVEEAAPQQK